MITSRLLGALCICVLSFSANASMVTAGGVPESSDYSLLSSAWDPGADTARLATGNPAPGGATWSIMGAGISDVSALDYHSGFSTTLMTELTGLDGVTDTDIENTIDKALDLWAAVSGFTNLGQVADSGAGMGATDAAGGNVGDIRVGAIYIDGGTGPNTLAHAWQPGTDDLYGVSYNILGDAHFDDSNSWFISDLNGSAFGTGAVDLLTVMIHEFGHSLGLFHSTVTGSIMEGAYAGIRTTLHADDIAGIKAIYGLNTSPVPIPAAVWLFASGLLGLIGIARRKKTA